MGMYSGYHGSILATSKPRLEKTHLLGSCHLLLILLQFGLRRIIRFPQSGIFQPAKLREPPHFDWQQNTLGNNVIPSPYFYTLENHICWNLTVLVGQHLESCCLKMGHLYLLANFIRNMVIPRGFSSPLVSLRMQFASSCFTALPPCPFDEIVPFWTKLGVQFQFKLVKWYTTIVMLYRVLLYYIMFYPNSCCLSPGLLPIKPKKKYPGREPLRLCVPSRPPTSHHEASATPVGELLPLGPHLIGPQTNCWMWWVNVKEKIIRLYIAKFGYNGSVHGVS